MAAARTAAFLCHALRHLFCRSLCSTCSLCPPHLAPCQLFCAPAEPQPMASQSSHQGKRLRHLNWPHSLTVCTAGREIPPVPLHTFPALAAAHPFQGSSGTTSATEQPPPAFGSASTRPAPGRRQQLGHLQDRKKDQPLAGEEQVLSTAVGCRVLQKKLRSQTRAMSVKRGGVMGRRLPWLCHRL